MRALFQGRTGCGGRPPGWHDIVTCQHLVISIIIIITLRHLGYRAGFGVRKPTTSVCKSTGPQKSNQKQIGLEGHH